MEWKAILKGHCKDCDVFNYCDVLSEKIENFDCRTVIKTLVLKIDDDEVYCIKNVSLNKIKSRRF